VLASEQDRPDVARRREQWKKYQTRIAPERLVFIDETWTKTNMAPLRGWAPRGKRLKTKVPHGHWKTMTFVAALCHDRIDAPGVLDGPVNGDTRPEPHRAGLRKAQTHAAQGRSTHNRRASTTKSDSFLVPFHPRSA